MGQAVWDLLHYQAVRMYHLYEGVFVMQTKKQLSIKGFFCRRSRCVPVLSGNTAHAAL